MALIIEDGSVVAGANSFVTVAEAIAYAEERNEAFPTGEGEVEGLLHHAMDYIASFRRSFAGQKVSPTQGTPYPRVNATVDGEPFPADAIPQELKQAQCQLAVDCYSIGGLQLTSSGYATSREKIDVIEVEYAVGSQVSGGSAPAEPSFPKADNLLESMFNGGPWLKTVRT